MKIYTDLSEVLIHGLYGTDKIIAEKFGEKAGLEFWDRHLMSNDEFRELLRGKMSEDEYWAEFLKKPLHPDLDLASVKAAFAENMQKVIPGTLKTYQRIVSYPVRLGENCGRVLGMPEIYIVSDHIAERISSLKDWHPAVFDVVNRSYWSCFLGKLKADPGFFEDLLDITGDRTDEIVFVDDMLGNINAAEQSGITGIQFHSADQLERDLENLGLEFAPKVP